VKKKLELKKVTLRDVEPLKPVADEKLGQAAGGTEWLTYWCPSASWWDCCHSENPCC
jgi:hypothetical protein